MCQPCGYDSPGSYTVQQLEQDITMLKGLGVQSIRLDIGFDAWLQNDQTTINKITTVVNFVRASGLTLIIADASAEQYRRTLSNPNGPLPWSQFKEAWVNRVQTLASLYHPNYYIVIKEPGWYVPMVSDSGTNPLFQSSSDWLNLTSWLVSTVKASSPNTITGISIAANSLSTNPTEYDSYLQGLPPGISFVGFDCYGGNGNSLARKYVSQYGTGGKQIWIAETWSQPLYNSNPQTDPAWLSAEYKFAVSIGATEMNPFYSNDFASYNPPVTNFVASTPVAATFQSLAA